MARKEFEKFNMSFFQSRRNYRVREGSEVLLSPFVLYAVGIECHCTRNPASGGRLAPVETITISGEVLRDTGSEDRFVYTTFVQFL